MQPPEKALVLGTKSRGQAGADFLEKRSGARRFAAPLLTIDLEELGDVVLRNSAAVEIEMLRVRQESDGRAFGLA